MTLLTFIFSSITAITGMVTAIGVYFVYRQARLLASHADIFKGQLEKDHERSRRENAVDLMKYYVEFRYKMGGGAKVSALLDNLDSGDAKRLYLGEEFSISKENFLALKPFALEAAPKIFEEYEKELENGRANGKFIVSPSLSKIVQNHVVTYLNVLEIVSAAYLANTVDQEMIKSEFKPVLLFQGTKRLALEFREVTGAYPSLREMEEIFVGSTSAVKKPILTSGQR